jgi:hypothetical protein
MTNPKPDIIHKISLRIEPVTKRLEKKVMKRLEDINLAYESKVSRIVHKNNDLQRDLGELRKRHGLPDNVDAPKQGNFLDTLDNQSLLEFIGDMKALAEKYCIPEDLRYELWRALWNAQSGWVQKHSGGPKRQVRRENGKLIWEIVITPDTDIESPDVQEEIKLMQLHDDPPPNPNPVPGNKHGKLDWRDVWEWNLRHPTISRRELAKLLNRDYQDVKRKLGKLDQEGGRTENPFV